MLRVGCCGCQDHEKSLAVLVKDSGKNATWMCHRGTCGWTGGTSMYVGGDGPNNGKQVDSGSSSSRQQNVIYSSANKKAPNKPNPQFDPELGDRAKEFFESRSIGEATLIRNGIQQEFVYCPALQKKVKAMAFPYFRDGEMVNIKYRGPNKTYWQVKAAEKVLYGLDDIKGQETIIIVEGELDKLALEEAGYTNVVSVPDGAPAKVKDGPVPANPEDDIKYQYLWNCREFLDPAKKV
jgi:twinkle protein